MAILNSTSVSGNLSIVGSLTISPSINTNTLMIINANGGIGTLKTSALTASREWTLPNDGGEIALSKNVPAVTLNGSAASTIAFSISGSDLSINVS